MTRRTEQALRAPRGVVLIGPRAVGKTTIGRELAARLGWPFADTDDDLAAAAGMPVGQLLRQSGEAAFRAREEPVVLAALAFPGPRVVALGGGAVLNPPVAARLREGQFRVVFLHAPVPTLVARLLASGDDRPALLPVPLADEVAALLARRRPIYEALADLDADTGAAPPAAIADSLHALLAADLAH